MFRYRKKSGRTKSESDKFGLIHIAQFGVLASKPIVIAYASLYGVAAVLSYTNGNEHPVIVMATLLSPNEKSYPFA